jgi:hypothetical protein
MLCLSVPDDPVRLSVDLPFLGGREVTVILLL